MFADIFGDIFGAARYVIESAGWVQLAIILGISVLVGLRMSGPEGILGSVFEAAILYALVSYLWNWLSSDSRFTYGGWERETLQSWDNFMGTSFSELIGYLGIFFVVILVVNVLKRFAR